MALIQCPECGHSVSNHAIACPNCGYPISADQQKNSMYKEEPAKNRLRDLHIIPKVDSYITEELEKGGDRAYLVTCQVIDEYFDGVKHSRLGEILGEAFMIRLNFSRSMEQRQDTIDQAALYYNLYPNSSQKLYKDMIEYYSVPELGAAIQRLVQHAKEEDGPYEAMMRSRGIVEPF